MHLMGLTELSERWRAMVRQLPSQCAVCRAFPSQRICNACVARFAQPADRCRRCALRVPPGQPVCGACIKNPPLFDGCLAAVDYAFPWTDAVSNFKFRSDPGWARSLASLLRSTPWVEPALDAADVVIPIPLSTERLRERGFNQSAVLARHLSATKTDARTLLRLHATEAQSGLSREARLRNLQAAFALEPSRAMSMRGRSVVLVDDVMTTGATVHAATVALREAGVGQVTVVVLARTARS